MLLICMYIFDDSVDYYDDVLKIVIMLFIIFKNFKILMFFFFLM